MLEHILFWFWAAVGAIDLGLIIFGKKTISYRIHHWENKNIAHHIGFGLRLGLLMPVQFFVPLAVYVALVTGATYDHLANPQEGS